MNNKFVLLFFCLFSSYNISYCQEIPSKVTHEIKGYAMGDLREAMEIEGRLIYLNDGVTLKSQKSFLNILSRGGKVDQKELKSPFKNSYTYEYFSFDDRLFRWMVTTKKNSETVERKIVEYSPTTGEVLGAMAVDEMDYSNKSEFPGHFQRYSPDSSKLVSVQHAYTKNYSERKILVVNSDLSITNKSENRIEGKKRKDEIYYEARVTNDGIVYLLYELREGDDRYKKKKQNYKYQVLRIDQDGGETIYDLDQKSLNSHSHTLYIDDSGKPMVFLTHHENHEPSSPLEGIAVYTIDESNNKFTKKYHAFDDKKLDSWGINTKKEKEKMNNFYVYRTDYLIDKDQIHILLERDYYYWIHMAGGQQQVNGKKAVIALSISNDGELLDDIFIPKLMELAKDGYVTTSLLMLNNKMHIAYMTLENMVTHDPDELKQFEKAKVLKTKKTALVFATKEGSQLIKKKVADTNNYMFYPSMIKVKGNRMILPCQKFQGMKRPKISNMVIDLTQLHNIAMR